jgi:hypothetical protein
VATHPPTLPDPVIRQRNRPLGPACRHPAPPPHCDPEPPGWAPAELPMVWHRVSTLLYRVGIKAVGRCSQHQPSPLQLGALPSNPVCSSGAKSGSALGPHRARLVPSVRDPQLYSSAIQQRGRPAPPQNTHQWPATGGNTPIDRLARSSGREAVGSNPATPTKLFMICFRRSGAGSSKLAPCVSPWRDTVGYDASAVGRGPCCLVISARCTVHDMCCPGEPKKKTEHDHGNS